MCAVCCLQLSGGGVHVAYPPWRVVPALRSSKSYSDMSSKLFMITITITSTSTDRTGLQGLPSYEAVHGPP